MSNILLVEEDINLTQMYKSVFESSGFKTIHFRNYNDLYKNLNGEGFTAIFLDSMTNGRTLDFISKIRKATKRQIPIFVALDDSTDPDPFQMFGNVTCIPRFPDSGNSAIELTKNLSQRSRFKDLLNKDKIN